MTNLNEIIHQMKEKQFADFCESLKATSAEKYFILAKHIRNNEKDENVIMLHLEASKSAYYALRSRLHNRIKNFLSENIAVSKNNLYHHVTHIPDLLYNTSKKSATAVLEKLEVDLVKSDMPYELSHVYSALKKIHIHSSKYFHYSQLYNKTLAYTTSLQKAEELTSDFNKALATYYVSRDKQLKDVMVFIRTEMHNLSSLYASHRLRLFRLFIDISFALYLPELEIIAHDPPVEDMLEEVNSILQSCPNDVNYLHLDKVYYFLAFEYYHSVGIHKKAAVYLDSLKENLPSFLLYNFCAFPSKILLSKIEHYTALHKQRFLYDENKTFLKDYSPDPEDVPGMILYNKYLALVCIINGRYLDAIHFLSQICMEINFRNYPHSELELKLLLSLCYSMENGYEMSEQTLKNIIRRINDYQDGEYENAKALAKLIHIQNSVGAASVNLQKKILKLRDRFNETNKGEYKMLEGLTLSDDFINTLCKFAKDNNTVAD